MSPPSLPLTVTNTNYEAPHYAVFFSQPPLISCPLSLCILSAIFLNTLFASSFDDRPRYTRMENT